MKENEIDESIVKDFIKHSEIAMKRFIEWGYREEVDLFLYRKIISMVGKYSENLEELLKEKKNNKFITLTYLTLISWDMDQRRAKIEFFDTYQKKILDNTDKILDLKEYSLEKISKNELLDTKAKLKVLYNSLDLMISEGRIVSNSKVLHFFLPDLIMPIDNNTLSYLKQNDSAKSFLKIFEFSWKIVNKMDLSRYVDNEKRNATIPKVIDNIILSLVGERGKKRNYDKKLNEFKKKILDGKRNKKKYRIGENKYQAISLDILNEIIEDIREEGNQYFDISLKEIIG